MGKIKKKNVGKTYVTVCLDASSSISDYNLTQRIIEHFNSFLKTLRETSEKNGLETFVSLITFASKVDLKFHPNDVRNVAELTYKNYKPYGSTALFDGLGKALELHAGYGSEDDSHLICVFTDGEENSSVIFNRFKIAKLIQEGETKGNLTITLQLPIGSSARVSTSLGIPIENCKEWEQNDVGARETSRATNIGTQSYLVARAAGTKAVKNFYKEVTTDLSKLAPKKLKSELEDLSDRFKAFKVEHECEIRDFVESRTKRDYVVGQAFYQLTKTEKIQPSKEILIMEKGGKQAIWGGNEARDLVGLPTDGKTHAKVEPGNHSGFDLFIESRSVNRLCVRGTKVLINMKLQKGKKPTWDHEAAEAAKVAASK